MAWTFYNSFKEGQFDGDAVAGTPIDFTTHVMKVLLVTSGNAPSAASDTVVTSAIAGSTEVTGTNYARKTLSSVTVASSGGTVTVDASDTLTYSQSSTGFSDARHAVLFRSNSSDASSPLVAYNTFSANKNNVSGNLTLQFSASSGIFTVSG